jgi:hypothetical protein
MAYAPGLKTKALVLVRKRRVLPLAGEVIVKENEIVQPDTVVARTYIPGIPVAVNVAEKFGLDPAMDNITYYLKKKAGDKIKQEEVLARSSSLFGLFKKEVLSPIEGVVENISDLTGLVVLREPPIPIELKAYIPGQVAEIMSKDGCIVETPAAFIQGIFGIGGETHGELKVVETTSTMVESDITTAMKGTIIVAPNSIDISALHKAAQVEVAGVVTSCIDEKELTEFMGYEIGVAITGAEEIGLTLIITEGFGNDLPMSMNTLKILKDFDGKLACINGATQIRAGVLRPEVIIPREAKSDETMIGYDVEDTEAVSEGLKPGILIRIIREPYFGAIGNVTSLPPELQVVETGSTVRILEAKLEDGRQVIVPRANVEIISE